MPTHHESPRVTRELRIAPVLTGGTSLSVWMGGATMELYCMLRSSPAGSEPDPGTEDSCYRRILELTETAPVVDVITGTSAGGLNGTLLAAAVAWGVPLRAFADLRSTWMTAADLDRLLRPLTQNDPPSLLDGDGRFIPPLKDQLARWLAQSSGRRGADVDLVTTFTAISPVPKRLVDDFGERMDEVTHAGVLRFRPPDFRAGSATTMPTKLAIASRVSASIPGVFETSYLPLTDADAATTGRPSFEGHAHIGSGGPVGWVVDGGLVVNLPLTEALDRVFEQRADGPVRRVFLYVSPTPSVPTVREPKPTERPTLTSTLLTVVSAPRAEGVAADLRTIADHNAAVARQRSARLLMAKVIGLGSESGEAFDQLMPDFIRRRAESSVASTLRHLDAGMGLPTAIDRDVLRSALVDLRADSAYMPKTAPSRRVSPRRLAIDPWRWGISPLEQSVSFAIGIVNRTLTLPVSLPADDPRAADVDRARAALGRLKTLVHRARDEARRLRVGDSAYWSDRVERLARTAQDSGPAGLTLDEVYAWGATAYAEWHLAGPCTEDQSGSQRRIREAMDLVAQALAQADPHVRTILAAGGADTSRRGVSTATTEDAALPSRVMAVQRTAQDLWVEYSSIITSGFSAPALIDLLRMHVYQVVALGDVINLEQPADVMQLSWNAKDYLTDRAPAAKLCGTEAARLGAFVKPSWRANDFFWGRMDAASRLIQLLLEPRRLLYLNRSSEDVLRALHLREGLSESQLSDLEEELAFLDDPDRPVPLTLPVSVGIIAARRQVDIARLELGNIARAVDASTTAGGHQSEAETAFLKAHDGAGDLAQRTDTEVTDLVGLMRVGEETLPSEQYSRLMVRSATKAASIGSTMLTSDSLGLPLVGKVLRGLRLPLKGLAAFAALIAGSSQTMVALGTLLAGTCGAVVAMALLGVALPAVLVTLGWTILVALFVYALLRHGAGAATVPAVVGVIVALAIVGGPGMREVFFTADGPRVSTSLNEADTVTFSGDAVARIHTTRDGAELVMDVPLTGGSIEVGDTGGSAVLETTGLPGSSSAWKQTWFTGGADAPPLAPWARAVLLVLGVITGWFTVLAVRRRDGQRFTLLALTVALLVLGAFTPQWGRAVFTGTPGDSGQWVKDWLVSAAGWLHDQRFWVVAALLVAVAALLGGIGDRARRALVR